MDIGLISNFWVIGMLFYMRYIDNQKNKFYEALIKEQQQDRNQLIEVIKTNTEAFTTFAETIKYNNMTVSTLQHNCEIRHGKVLKEIKEKNDWSKNNQS